MENFVLGFFQEQLSKFIVGFRKEQVNANLLNGKGEIKDVSLNCAALNDVLATVTPFVELESVHVSRLSFHVTSWANLKKAPILIDVGDIRATIVEPLHFLDTQSGKRKKIRQISTAELDQLIAAGKQKLRGPYNLFDRIMDNLTLEISSIHVTFQPRGKFKTRRAGPWTPPKIVASMRHVRYVSVNEYGQEASPEEVWRHNRHHHNEPMAQRAFLIFKKLSMVCNLSLHPQEQKVPPPPLIKQGQVEIQIALRKRLRDGAILAVQLDATLAKVEVQVDASMVPILAHTVAGVQYCFAKDRAFEDPLLGSHEAPSTPTEEGFEASLSDSDGNVELEGVTRDGSAVISGSFRSEQSEEAETASVDATESQEKTAETSEDVKGVMEQVADELSSSSDEAESVEETRPQNQQAVFTSTPERNKRPVLLLPNGLVIHERVSCSLSVHHLSVRGTYGAKTNGYVQLTIKGVIAEVMWPKVTGEKGAYAQLSMSYISLQERLDRSIRSMLVGGIQDETYMGPVENPSTAPLERMGDVNFPLFEDRSIREDPLGLRHSFPAQAFGLKSTVDFVGKATGGKEDVMVLHEIGIDRFDVVLDMQAWCRSLKFVLNEDGGGFDPRWHSGDWIEELTTEMLVHPSQTFCFEDHVQPCKEIFLDENLLISSDLLNVTARITNVELRVPAAIEKDVRSCDIVVSLAEAMLLISSALPRTFLTGKIGRSVKVDNKTEAVIEFPNDPSDICYSMEKTEDPCIRQSGSETSRAVSTFRIQLTMRGHSVRVSPIIPFCNASKPQEVLAPDDLNLIACFEGEPPESPNDNLIKIALFISILIQKMEVNCDFDILTGAISTFQHHIEVTHDAIESLQSAGIIPTPVATPIRSSSKSTLDKTTKDTRIRSSIRGRRVLVRRQFQRSRETGGLSVALCLQINEFGFHLWRQNVPQSSRFRPTSESECDASASESPVPLVHLMEYRAQDLEIGLEFSTNAGNRRIVWKFCLSGMSLKACDFVRECAEHRQRIMAAKSGEKENKEISADEGGGAETTMVNVLTLKQGVTPDGLSAHTPSTTDHRDVLLRLEEQLSDVRSISLACEVTTDGVIDLESVDEIECLFVLVVESLLLPTGRHSFAHQNPRTFSGFGFPSGSVGALLESLLKELISAARSLERGIDDLNGANADVTVGDITLALQRFVKRLLPKDTGAALLRFSSRDMLFFIPGVGGKGENGTREPNPYCLFMTEAALASAYFGSSKLPDEEDPIMDVLARSGNTWDNFFGDHDQGLHFSLQSEQSLHLVSRKGPAVAIERTLLPSFESLLSYRPTGVSASTGSTHLSLDGTDNLRQLFMSISAFGSRCIVAGRNIIRVLSSLRTNRRLREPEEAVLSAVVATTDSKGNESPRIEANSDVVDSIRTSRSLLDKMRTSLSKQQLEVRKSLEQKQREMDHLRCMVFFKERERIAALALLSSSAMGWIRMGGTHQSGQRTATTTSMWRYWAVLRRSLLILFTAPGGEPVEFISLRGASLLPLAGGRTTRDIKTGFAIVEKGGMTRFFVAGNGVEYEMWVREIQYVVNEVSEGKDADEFNTNKADVAVSPAHEDNPDLVVNAVYSISQRDSSHFQHIEQPVMHSDTDMQSKRKGQKIRQSFAGTKARLGSAVQAAKQNVKAASEKQRQRSLNHGVHGSQGVAPLEVTTKHLIVEDQAVSDSAHAGEKLEEAPHASSSHVRTRNVQEHTGIDKPDEHYSPTQRKRAMLRQRFAGTKARLGSAVQVTKQKVKAAAEKQRQHQASLESSSVGSADDAKASHNELLHHPHYVSFERSAVGNGLGEQEPGGRRGRSLDALDEETAATSQDGTAYVTDLTGVPNAGMEDDEIPRAPSMTGDAVIHEPSDEGSPRRSGQIRKSVSKIGSAVISGARVNGGATQNPKRNPTGSPHSVDEAKGRFSLRRFSKNQANPGSFVGDCPDAIKLKSIRVGAGSVEGCSDCDTQRVPLKRIGGHWLVHVDFADFAVNGDGKHVDDEAFSSSEPKISSDEVSGHAADLETREQQLERSNQELSASPVSETVAEANATVQRNFKISVVCKRLPSGGTATKPSQEVVRSFADILLLHTVVSEALGQVAPMGAGTAATRNDSGEMNESLASQLGLSPLDNVRMTGNLLGSLFDATSMVEDCNELREYQCEIITEFLKSTVNCPLPLEACAAVVRFLDIRDIVTEEDWMEPTDTAEHEWGRNVDEDARLHSSSTESIMSLSAACEAELLRAETRELLAPRLSPSPGRETPAEMPSQLQYDAPAADASLPSSISETLHASMHQALMKVMSDRDEAHAQLVAGHVLHVHELEQERKKVDRLNKQMELIKNDTGGTSFFLGGDEVAALEKERIRNYERQLMQNSDAELISLCQQLASEISEKTSAALEVIRLKELRKIEREGEMAEREALQKELKKYKEMVAAEQTKSEEAQQAATKWKESYEKLLETSEDK